MNIDERRRAARAIREADGMLIGAGAGMGVDSGLPDFRGNEGFWKAYPPYQKLGMDFYRLANPRWFQDDLAVAWGFYGHRLNLYRATRPHNGFHILREWSQRLKHGAFVFTSNVDGHFQEAGFPAERVVEVHGSIHWLQCLYGCSQTVFPQPPEDFVIDEASMRANQPYPSCPSCQMPARPNILMFGDFAWDESRTARQKEGLEAWLETIRESRLVVIEIGAGKAIPTVRRFCEDGASYYVAQLVRINPREPDVPPGGIGIAAGALESIISIDELL